MAALDLIRHVSFWHEPDRCDVRSESAFGGKAEVWLKGRQVRC